MDTPEQSSVKQGDTMTPETSPLLREISEAIRLKKPSKGILHVSVADEPKWEKSPSGDDLLIRWGCWNLEENGHELTEPVFIVLCAATTREQLAKDLPQVFPELEVHVDNDIVVAD